MDIYSEILIIICIINDYRDYRIMIIVMTRFPKIKFGHCDLNATITGVQRTSWSKNFRIAAANVSARGDDLR